MRAFALSTLLVLSICGTAVAKTGSCLGLQEIPDLDQACKLLKSTQSCLKSYSYKAANISTSCTWRETYTDKIVEKAILYTKAPRFSAVLISNGSFSGARAEVTLPKDSANAWGLFNEMSTQGAFSGCSAGLGVPLSCMVKIVAPKQYANSALFANPNHQMRINFRDVKLAQQVQKNGVLDKQVPLTMKYTFFRTGATPAPPATDLASSSLPLGSYTTETGEFSLGTTLVYKFGNVSGVSWDANVTKSLEANGNTTAINAWMMTDTDFAKWKAVCNTSCTPPKNLAIKDTFCAGLNCKGRAKNLKPTDKYYLIVSYPIIYSSGWSENVSKDGPITNPFPAQVVNVIIRPKDYVIASTSRTIVTEGDSEYAMTGPWKQ